MQDSSSAISKLLAAATFAATKHAPQRRKGPNDVPYINHPLEVAHILAYVAHVTDEDVLVAAILHDTIEDTNTTADEIGSSFGDKVQALVLECTDDKNLPAEIRKQLQVEHAPQKSPEAKLIKIADKISNIRDLGISPPVGWSHERCGNYLTWCDKVVSGLRGGCPALDALFDQSLAGVKAKLGFPVKG